MAIVLCGAKRRTCLCGHRKNQHVKNIDRCTECGKSKKGCQHFEHALCQRIVKTGDKHCYKHRARGAAARIAGASPNFKHGRFSAHMPADMLDRYAQGIDDPELLNLSHEVAALDARVSQLMGNIGNTGDAGAWSALSRVYKSIRAGVDKNDMARVADGLNQIGEIVRAGENASVTWSSIAQMWDLRRKLVESETRRLKDLHQMITIAEAFGLIKFLADSVNRHVKDAPTHQALTADFAAVTAGRIGALASSGSATIVDD